jgi:hypothetical protein
MSPDIFMIVWTEVNAQTHWERLRAIAPHSLRIDGINGIAAAYATCAAASRTANFFVVDADNWVVDGFAFDIQFEPKNDEVAVWRSLNPVNGLIYGHGAVKLLPTAFSRASARRRDVDVIFSVVPNYRVVQIVASEHRFNTGPFETWRTAFRECVKLASRAIPRQHENETVQRLDVWCSTGANMPNGRWSLLGAQEGRAFGKRYSTDKTMLARTNDFAWLRRLFVAQHGTPM